MWSIRSSSDDTESTFVGTADGNCVYMQTRNPIKWGETLWGLKCVILLSSPSKYQVSMNYCWQSPRNYSPGRQRLQKGRRHLQKTWETSRNCWLVISNEWRWPERDVHWFNKAPSVMPRSCVRPSGHLKVWQTLSLLSGGNHCACGCVKSVSNKGQLRWFFRSWHKQGGIYNSA